MPPVHVLPHIVRAGGIPAGLGVLLALVLGWPREDSRLPSGTFDPTTLATTYHSAVVGSGHTLEGAVGSMLLLAIVLALVGLGVGYLLVALGVVEKDDLGAE